MKKLISFLIVVLVVLTSLCRVSAAQFESINLNMELPKGYYDLTKGIEEDDKKMDYYIALMSTTKEQLKSEYISNSILYNGISTDFANEIYLSYVENQVTKNIFHLSLADEEQLENVKDEIAKTAEAQNMQVTSQDTYVLGDILYINTLIKKGSTAIYQYYTIVNGKGITLSLNSSDSSAKNDDLKKIVDSISFDNIEEKPTSLDLYILIGVTALLIIMVVVLVFMACFGGKRSLKQDDEIEENEDN